MTQTIGGPLTRADVERIMFAAREYQFDTQPTPATNADPGLIPYHTWVTSPLTGGTYQLAFTFLAGGGGTTSQNTQLELGFTINGGPVIPGPLQSFGVSEGRFGFGPAFPLVLPPGPATFVLLFGHPSSPGIARIVTNTFTLERVA